MRLIFFRQNPLLRERAEKIVDFFNFLPKTDEIFKSWLEFGTII